MTAVAEDNDDAQVGRGLHKLGHGVSYAIDIMRTSHYGLHCQSFDHVTLLCLVRLHGGFGLGSCVLYAMTRAHPVEFGRSFWDDQPVEKAHSLLA